MDIPIEIFLSFIAFAFTSAIIGLWKKTPFLMFVGAGLITFWTITTDNIIYPISSTEGQTEIIYYQMEGFGDATTALNNVNHAEIEFVSSPTSLLDGSKIQCVDIILRKSGTPSSATQAIVGLFDVNNTELFRFGSISPPSVSTVFTIYDFCVDEGEEITLGSGDRIGVSYTSGTASDRLETRENTQNTFDGSNTFRQIYTTSWQSSSTTDFVMKLYDIIPEESGQFTFEFTEYPKILFGIMASILMLAGALIWRMED